MSEAKKATPKAPRKRTPKKDPANVPPVASIIAPIAPAPAVEAVPAPTVPAVPAQGPVETQPHHLNITQEIEGEAVTIWGRIRAWKYFWWVVVGLALLLVFLGYQWINNIQNKRSETRIEQKEAELKQIKVGGDTSLLQLKVIEAQRIYTRDSINAALRHALDDLKKANDIQTSILQKSDIINQETKATREKINNPANSDDDVIRNARSQMSNKNTGAGN